MNIYMKWLGIFLGKVTWNKGAYFKIIRCFFRSEA